MDVSRRDFAVAGALALSASSLLLAGSAGADAADEAAVAQGVETLRKALLEADRAKLEQARPRRSAMAIPTAAWRPRSSSSTA